MLFSAIPFAADTCVGDGDKWLEDKINYEVISEAGKTVKVGDNRYYQGAKVEIKSTVRHDGVDYRVVAIGDEAFQNNTTINEVIISEGVTSIGNYAFNKCRYLTKINIPDGMETIGDSAFNKTGIESSLIIPDSVTSIGDNAFCGCTKMTSVTIGNGVSKLNGNQFDDCNELTTVYLGAKVELKSPDSGFGDSSEITTVTILNKNSFILNYNLGKSSPTDIFVHPDAVDDFKEKAITYQGAIKPYALVQEPVGLELPYNGEFQSGIAVPETDKGKYNLTGDFKAKEIGEYTAFAELVAGNVWADNTFDKSPVEWSIVASIEKKEIKDDSGKVISEFDFSTPVRADANFEVKPTADVPQTIKDLLRDKGDAKYSYSIRITVDGKEIQPEGKVIVRLLMPDDVGEGFEIYHIHGGAADKVNHEIAGDYAVFEVGSFSDFAFVETGEGPGPGPGPDDSSNGGLEPWAIALIVVTIVLMALALAYYFMFYKKGKDITSLWKKEAQPPAQ